MTIPATPRRSPVYVGNGVATSYAFGFKVTDPATLVVTIADADDLNAQELEYVTDYTVTLNVDQNADPGGEVSYAGLPVGHRLVITSATDSSQPVAITNLGKFHANVLEDALDRLAILHQQQQEQIDRAVKVGVTSEQDPSDFLQATLDIAANSAQQAAGSASAAQSARTGAEAALDAFDDRYLGAKAADPATDNDGAALIDGALYWNTANKRMRIYSLATTSWGPFPATAADVAVSPAGGVVASDVQAAIEELDAEKVAKSGDTMTGPLTVPMVVTDSPMSFRNKLINGNFDIWQRGTSTVSSNTFLADRWKYVSNTAGGSTVSPSTARQDFAPGQVDVPGEPQHFCRVVGQISGGSGTESLLFHTRIEDVRTLAGKTVTLSLYAKASGARTVNFDFTQNFGSGGSSSVRGNFGAAALTTAWQKFTFTVTIPSISGKTRGNSSYLEVALVQQAGAGSSYTTTAGSSAAVDIAQVQLEEGNVATPFEQRPIGVELSLCQRYYEDSAYPTGFGSGYYCGMWVVAANASFGVQFKTTKRALPSTVTVRAAASGNLDKVRDDTGGAEVAVTGKYGYGVGGFLFTVGAAAAAGNRALWHYTADAEL